MMMFTMTHFMCVMLMFGLCHSAVSFQPLSSQTRFVESRYLVTRAMSASNDESDPVLRLPLMEAELASTNDEQRKSELEEEISNAKTAAEFGVRRAQAEFYQAFAEQNVEAMKRVWSCGEDVRCVHPGMESLNGIDDVMKSWQQVFSGPAFPIEPSRVSLEICGKTAFCSCIEKTSNDGKLEALNIYRREGGSWKMTLHMASPIVMRVSLGSE